MPIDVKFLNQEKEAKDKYITRNISLNKNCFIGIDRIGALNDIKRYRERRRAKQSGYMSQYLTYMYRRGEGNVLSTNIDRDVINYKNNYGPKYYLASQIIEENYSLLKCWYCGDKVDIQRMFHLPVKKRGGIYYCRYNFCDIYCAFGYAERCNNSNSLLYLYEIWEYIKKKFNITEVGLSCPPLDLLKYYSVYGQLDYPEFHAMKGVRVHKVCYPPMILITPQVAENFYRDKNVIYKYRGLFNYDRGLASSEFRGTNKIV